MLKQGYIGNYTQSVKWVIQENWETSELFHQNSLCVGHI